MAFAIYGCLNGFANLTRDFTDILLNNIDSEYLKSFYKELYKEIFNKELKIEKTEKEPEKTKADKKNKGNKTKNNKSKKGTNEKNTQTDLQFEYKPDKYFYNDSYTFELIKDLLPKDTHNEIKEDLVWFQKELKKPNEERKFYKGVNEKVNSNIIDKFVTLKQGKDKNGKEKAPYFTPEIRDKVKQKLLELYPNE